MSTNLNTQLAALRQMTSTQLREKYLEAFGEPSRSGNKAFLFKRIAWRIQSLAEGTLSERARRRAAELARDADIRTTIPRPPQTTPGSTTTSKPAPTSRDERIPIPGSVLTRKYKGRQIEVVVLPKGFEREGNVFALKCEWIELFGDFDTIGDGAILVIEVAHGLPIIHEYEDVITV